MKKKGKMNASQKKAFAIGLCLTLFFWVGAFIIVLCPKPAEMVYEPWIPTGARIVSGKEVTTGTFKIYVNKAEMIQKVKETGETPLVVFFNSNRWEKLLPRAKVEYWLPDKGGIFNFFIDDVPIGSLWFNWNGIFDSGKGVFIISPARSWGFFAIAIFLGVVSFVFAGNAWVKEIFEPGES